MDLREFVATLVGNCSGCLDLGISK